MQKAIPYMHIRGGSSKGLYFNAKDLPSDEALRNKYLLAAIEGSDLGDARQIDGLGGGSSLSSKVAIVSMSDMGFSHRDSFGAISENTSNLTDIRHPISDIEIPCLDYYFVQVMIGKGKVSTTQTCGNILAGVLPFAIESGMIEATHPTTRAIINIVNTGGQCEVIVETPNGKVNYAGNAKVDGVMGTAAPIICNYLNTEAVSRELGGATCGALFPTTNPIDVIDGKEMTCIDNGMPVVLLRANDFGITGYETKEELDNNTVLKKEIESIRLQVGYKMNLGDVKDQTIPKMCLIAPPQYNGIISTRMFIPHVCHDAIGVLAAVSVATACIFPHTITHNIASIPNPQPANLSIEHPTGEMTVTLETEGLDNSIIIKKSGILRTARLLSKGEVFIPLT